jgi:hypothetical protein
MLIPAAGSAVTLTARGFPDASTRPGRAAWMVTAGKKTGDCERRPDSGRARPRGPAQQQRKAQTDEPSTSPRQAHYLDHGTGLRRPGSQCGRYPRGPCRDPPGSCHVRSDPGGFAEPSAGSLLTMPLAPGRPAQNRYTPPRRRAGSHARGGPRRATVSWPARIAIASGRYPHSPAPGRLAGSNSPNGRHRGPSAVRRRRLPVTFTSALAAQRPVIPVRRHLSAPAFCQP